MAMYEDNGLLNRQRRVGVILSYATLGLSTIISIVYTPYMLRCLGQGEYGLYQLIGSLAQYLSLLSLGLSGSYIRFFVKYKQAKGTDGVDKLNGIYLSVFLIMTCIVILSGLFMTIKLPLFFEKSMDLHELKTGQLMMFLMTVNAALTLPMTIFTSYIAAYEKFIFQRSVKLIYGIFHPIMCVIALYWGGKATVLIIVALVCTILMISSEILYCVRKLNFRAIFKGIKISDFIEIFSFSVFVLLNDIINQINWSVDKIILGYFSGTTAIAVYGIAAQLNTYYLSISTTISSVYVPQINHITSGSESEEKERTQLNLVFYNVGRVQSMIMALVITGYIFFGRQFILLWAGQDYGESYYVGLWLMIPAVIPLLQNTGIEIQRARNKHRTRTIVYLLIAIGNVIMSIPLCKVFGAIGCAIGTAISLVVGNVLFMNWYYQRFLDIDILGFWKKIFKIVPAMIIPVFVGILIKLFGDINNYFMLSLYILFYALVFCASVYYFMMISEEKYQLRRFFKKGRE